MLISFPHRASVVQGFTLAIVSCEAPHGIISSGIQKFSLAIWVCSENLGTSARGVR